MRTGTLIIAAAVTAVLALGSPALAADIDFSAYTPGDTIDCRDLEGATPTGQVFTIPAGETRLESVSIGISSDDVPPQPGTLTLHPFAGGQPDLLTVLGTTSYELSTSHPDFVMYTLTFPGGLPVVEGETYMINAQKESSGGQCLATQGDVYADGDVYDTVALAPGIDAFFTARFVQSVPTLSEWAMLLMGLTLAGGAVLMIQRRRFTA